MARDVPLAVLALLALLEGGIALALRTPPGSGPDSFERARSDYYLHYERQIVQYLPDCAEYDPELGYRLAPGSCRFRNREFDVRLEINSLGVRDAEEALSAPRIVVTGDSFAMGWGVAQSETLSAVLARATGEKTLNLAISSYGTARELIGLLRADLSAAHTLVIQYCDNDYKENRRFQFARGSLPVMSREDYEATTRQHRDAIRYLPGKYVWRFLPLWWRAAGDDTQPEPWRSCSDDADAFLRTLELAPRPPLPAGAALRLVVFEGLYELGRPDCFAAEVEERARQRELPAWISELHTIESSRVLEPSDYFPLDQHLRASGHAKLAAAIAARLSSGAPGEH